MFSIFQRKKKPAQKKLGFAKVTEDGNFYLDFNDPRTKEKVIKELRAIKDIELT